MSSELRLHLHCRRKNIQNLLCSNTWHNIPGNKQRKLIITTTKNSTGMNNNSNNKNNTTNNNKNNNKDLDIFIKTGSAKFQFQFHYQCNMTSKWWSTTTTTTALMLLLLLLQQQCIMIDALKPLSSVAGIVNGTMVTDLITDQCITYVGDKKVIKEAGSVWISPENPCEIYVCETDKRGQAQIKITKEDCADFYCDVDSELQAQEGTCCGTCVRTKCRFNDDVYDVGQTWHNKKDCTLLECTQLPNGLPMINAYQKTCPPMPRDCAPEETVFEDCCYQCKSSRNRGLGTTDVEDIWTEEFYRNHPCVRECRANEPPRTCHYTFVVEWYETLSKACYECPNNSTDCDRPHCITGDGIRRSITVVNRMMPGPSIEVCENDIIVVDVENDLLGESTTIHWHGLHQSETPYMDGVPHVSQCPISPHSKFRYTFKADNVGTHFWHSHTGMQRGDGVFGPLMIRRPRASDPHGHLYDFDLSEHNMMLQDWVQVPGVSMFASHHHSLGDNKPHNILINGRGRYYGGIWEMLKRQAKIHEEGEVPGQNETAITPKTETVPITTTTKNLNVSEASVQSQEPKNLDDQVDFLHSLDTEEQVKMRLRETNEISRLARLARKSDSDANANSNPNLENLNTPINYTTSAPPTQSVLQRSRRAITDNNSAPLDKMPLQIYNVKQGFRYRFRLVNAEFLNCPIQMSIDNHSLTAINSDGYDFEPVEVGSIVTYAGERWDFIVNADQPVRNYWIRLKGLMDCDERFTSAFQVGILHYEGAGTDEPTEQLGYDHKPDGIELNTMNRGPGNVDSLTIAELTALPKYDSVLGVDRDVLKPVADYKFFVYYDFYPKDNPSFHKEDLYGFNANLSNGNMNRLFTPQLNHISLKFPTVALLSARDQVDESMFCNETSLQAQGIDCRKEFCKCHHVLQVPLNSIVEFIIVDEGFAYDANHPFHLHGNAFRVVGLERLGNNVTIEMVKQLERYNLLKRNLIRPPIKDTVTVPDGGYTIIRFKAYNPGFWLFHCHIEFHAEIGMALVLKVGDNDEMLPVPKNFPTCHDYMPDDRNGGDADSTTDSGAITVSAVPDKNRASTKISSIVLLLGMLMITNFCKLKS